MNWTNETPTVPGWYWVKWPTCKPPVMIVEIFRDNWDNSLSISWVGTSETSDVEEVGLVPEHRQGVEWCGPLVPPT